MHAHAPRAEKEIFVGPNLQEKVVNASPRQSKSPIFEGIFAGGDLEGGSG